MNKSLRKRFVLIIVLAVMFILIVLNLHKIKFAINMLSLYNQSKNTESTTEESKPVADNPLLSIIETVDTVDNQHQPVDNPANAEDKNEQYVAIAKEYNEKFEDIHGTFDVELNSLISKGIEEYRTGKISSPALANKYLSEGSKLEKIADNEFNNIVKTMEEELKSNNQDTSIIKELKDYYLTLKDEKKQDLINNGMKYIK